MRRRQCGQTEKRRKEAPVLLCPQRQISAIEPKADADQKQDASAQIIEPFVLAAGRVDHRHFPIGPRGGADEAPRVREEPAPLKQPAPLRDHGRQQIHRRPSEPLGPPDLP